jgi:hypothetical protein
MSVSPNVSGKGVDHPVKARFSVALLLAFLGTASAGSIDLRSGTLDFESLLAGSGAVHLEGNRRFVFDGFAQNTRLDAADCVFGCDPGETVSLFAAVGGNDLRGQAVLGRRSFDDVGGLLSAETLSLTIKGFATVPRLGRAAVKTQVVPVRLIGFFHHGTPTDPAARVVEEMAVKAIAVITWIRSEGGFWSIAHLTYNIAPGR